MGLGRLYKVGRGHHIWCSTPLAEKYWSGPPAARRLFLFGRRVLQNRAASRRPPPAHLPPTHPLTRPLTHPTHTNPPPHTTAPHHPPVPPHLPTPQVFQLSLTALRHLKGMVVIDEKLDEQARGLWLRFWGYLSDT